MQRKTKRIQKVATLSGRFQQKIQLIIKKKTFKSLNEMLHLKDTKKTFFSISGHCILKYDTF